ncbi:putative hemolysin-III channel protein Izh2 [Microthyrium microscopicum]|uniref:Putative hemolysin-III channel protein Izh2 n=1 Tax=Microthyrium microscopicum TaxID=703497 RepID=A0A6A6URH3_9PEZI|nr:putative hemolysin-III channel protein Izh2 [Microthyrium microscopicum]
MSYFILTDLDNPAILSGYRPQSDSYLESFRSLFYLHNESVNVYSHLGGAIIFALLAPVVRRHFRSKEYKTASKEDLVAMSCFFLGAIGCLSFSGLFHLFSNHSDPIAKFGNQLDYLGIVLLIWGSFIPSILYGFQERTDLIKVYWTMITTIGLATAYASISPSFRTPEWRAFRAGLFISMGMSAVFPILHGAWLFGLHELDRHISLKWLLLEGVAYISGALLYAARTPEKYWPGNFDLFFSSHQIFHFLVLVAASSHLVGLIKAFHRKHTGPNASVKVFGRTKID